MKNKKNIPKSLSFAIFMIIIGGITAGFFLVKTPESENLIELINNTPQDSHSPHPDSIPAMSEKEFTGDNLQLVKKIEENDAYTKYSISYNSEGFKVSGIMNVPHGEGPFPIIFTNHGYIDPGVYSNGQGLRREQDYLARQGYVVFHSDYRNHAFSDFDPNNEVRPRSGYVEDILNAISAVRNSDLSFIDKENMGMLGHSMGGGVTLNVMVTKPDWIKAYVLLAPIHADYKRNFDRWVKTTWPETAQEFYETYGTYEQNQEFWKSISAINYFDRIQTPIMLHQGTADAEFPYTWSVELEENLKNAKKDITYYEYPNEGHLFLSTHSTVMKRSTNFFDSLLKK